MDLPTRTPEKPKKFTIGEPEKFYAYQESAHTDLLWYNGMLLARFPLPGGV
jgi:hypothetical protein